DDECREAATLTTLHILGYAVDRYDTLEMRGLLLGRPATATVLAVPAVLAAAAFTLAGRPALLTAGLPCTSRHQAFLPFIRNCLCCAIQNSNPASRAAPARAAIRPRDTVL